MHTVPCDSWTVSCDPHTVSCDSYTASFDSLYPEHQALSHHKLYRPHEPMSRHKDWLLDSLLKPAIEPCISLQPKYLLLALELANTWCVYVCECCMRVVHVWVHVCGIECMCVVCVWYECMCVVCIWVHGVCVSDMSEWGLCVWYWVYVCHVCVCHIYGCMGVCVCVWYWVYVCCVCVCHIYGVWYWVYVCCVCVCRCQET